MPASIMALDVGDRRIGVAVANAEVRLARPLTTLLNDETVWDRLKSLVDEHAVQTLVAGLPRGLEGQETGQTRKTEVFIVQLRSKLTVPVVVQDEAATSLKAEAELRKRGKPYQKADIDALAATYILEDYLGVTGNV